MLRRTGEKLSKTASTIQIVRFEWIREIEKKKHPKNKMESIFIPPRYASNEEFLAIKKIYIKKRLELSSRIYVAMEMIVVNTSLCAYLLLEECKCVENNIFKQKIEFALGNEPIYC